MTTNRCRAFFSAGAVVLTVWSGLVLAPPATGDEAPTITDTTVEVAGTREIAKAASSAERSGDLTASEDEFLDDQARMGNTVDAEAIDSARVDGAVMVWEDGVKVTSLETSQITVGGEDVGSEVEQVAGPDPAYANAELAEPDTRGIGSDSITGATGGKFDGGYCTTTTVSEQKLTQCFERYRIQKDNSKTRDYYYYGRWATAEGEKNWGPLPDWIPTKIDIRSRPWTGKRGNFATLVNYWPKGGNTSCSSSGEISVGFKGFSGSMPIRDCSETTPIVDATKISMGAIFDQGTGFHGRVHSADFAMVVATFAGKRAPMGDYGYAKFCKFTYAGCEGVLRKDGW